MEMANDKLERDKFLIQAMGYKWHECHENPDGFYCRECEEGLECVPPLNLWVGFGYLMEWLKDQPLWTKIRWNMPMAEFMDLVTDPDKAANAVYKYLKEGK